MNRRKFLKHAASFPVLPALAPLLAKISPQQISTPTAGRSAFRRVRPSDPGWPTAAQWDALKNQVGGRLIPVTDPLAPCKSSPASSAACVDRMAELKNPFWLSETPGATQIAGWLDAWTSVPSVYAVAARSAQDVAAA